MWQRSEPIADIRHTASSSTYRPCFVLRTSRTDQRPPQAPGDPPRTGIRPARPGTRRPPVRRRRWTVASYLQVARTQGPTRRTWGWGVWAHSGHVVLFVRRSGRARSCARLLRPAVGPLSVLSAVAPPGLGLDTQVVSRRRRRGRMLRTVGIGALRRAIRPDVVGEKVRT